MSIDRWMDKEVVVHIHNGIFSSVQFSCSVVPYSAMPKNAAHRASLSITNSQSLLKLMSIVSVMPSNRLTSVVPLSSHLQSFPATGYFPMSQFFAPDGQSQFFSISPFNEYSGLISFRMDGLDLLAVQETLKGLLQHHSSKASILQCSTFFFSFHFFILSPVKSVQYTQSCPTLCDPMVCSIPGFDVHTFFLVQLSHPCMTTG